MDAEAEATSATSMFPKLGVKLSVFDDFIQQCGGVEALRGKTTTQVCDHVKLKTLAIKDSYCNMLAAENYATVAKATVFIRTHGAQCFWKLSMPCVTTFVTSLMSWCGSICSATASMIQ
jgi:hypothetical protein